MVKRENNNVIFLIPNLYPVGLCLNMSLVFREHPERPLLRWKAGDVSECVGVQRDRASGCCWRNHFSSSFRAGIWKGNIYRPPTDWSFTAALHNHTSINNACVNVCVWWLKWHIIICRFQHQIFWLLISKIWIFDWMFLTIISPCMNSSQIQSWRVFWLTAVICHPPGGSDSRWSS